MKADERRAIEAAGALARRARFVYVSTNGAGGYPNTRVMYNLLNRRAPAIARGAARLSGGFATWLGTNISSGKVAEMRRDPRVCLYYSDNVTFRAEAVRGA